MTGASNHDRESEVLWERAVALQKAYWSFDQGEKDALYARYKSNKIGFADLLRLHHLVCMEMFAALDAAGQLHEGYESVPAYQGPLEQDVQAMVVRLLGPDSPYRPVHASVWFEGAGEEPSSTGYTFNASLTHLGSVEALRVDEHGMPCELVFVPFDEICDMVVQGRSLLRAGKIFHELGKGDEIVWLPLLYGFSWHSPDPIDRDGSMTRFVGHIDIPAQKKLSLAIGLGHQDFWLMDASGTRTLIGLGKLRQLTVSLELNDPRFDAKCRGRGLDPDEVRRQFD